MPIKSPPTLAARRHLAAVSASLDAAAYLTADARFEMRCHVMALSAQIDAVEATTRQLGGAEVLAAVRAFAERAAPDLIAMFLDRQRGAAIRAGAPAAGRRCATTQMA